MLMHIFARSLGVGQFKEALEAEIKSRLNTTNVLSIMKVRGRVMPAVAHLPGMLAKWADMAHFDPLRSCTIKPARSCLADCWASCLTSIVLP